MKLRTDNPRFVRIEFAADASAFALQFFTPGLADHTYLIVSGDQAALIDPQRDYGRFLEAADELGVRLIAVFETHVHNDYVSGGNLVSRARGAAYFLPADSGATLEHTALRDGEAVELGECSVVAIHTPGHTPHHMSYALHFGDERLAVFTGGSMLIAGVGRTDLLGPELAEPLAHDQFRSVNRIAGESPDETAVGPTHGAGSFCGSAQTNETVTQIGQERRRNPALLTDDENRFVNELLAGYKLYPDYYRHMAPINVVGVKNGAEFPPAVEAAELESLAHDHLLIDVRNSQGFASGHIPGSINIPNAGSAAVYAGWSLPWNARLVLIASSAEMARMAWDGFYRIGNDRVDAVVTDGLRQWRAEGRTLRSYRVATFSDMEGERPDTVIDARDPAEFADVRVAGAINRHFSDMYGSDDLIASGTVWIHCESGFRAAIASSILDAAGNDVVLVDDHISNSKLLTGSE